MECFWCLFRHRQPDGHRYQQDPTVFYLCLPAYSRLAYYNLYGSCILEEYEKVHTGNKEKPVVLSLARLYQFLYLLNHRVHFFLRIMFAEGKANSYQVGIIIDRLDHMGANICSAATRTASGNADMVNVQVK